MKTQRQNFFPQIIIIAAVMLIGVCFAASTIIIDKYAEGDCFDSIEETTSQALDMFVHTMEQSQTQLTLFADILAVNESNPDGLLRGYMQNFCNTQNFAAVCIHRADGTTESYGFHPHEEVSALSFSKEKEKLPYVSTVFSEGDKRSEKYVYQAVPIVRDGNTVAILYGYISLDTFPEFISSTAYDGKCQFYIVDGNDGSFLMDEYHRFDKKDAKTELPLGNVFDGSMGKRETKDGYTMEEMRHNIKNGESGYFIFKSQRTGDWYYTYYMPMNINNWSIQLTIDEPTAFATYYHIRSTVFTLMLCVLILASVVIFVLMLQHARVRKIDRENLRKSDYINDVQGALISAHNNPEFVNQALKIVAKASKAETVLLLTFSDKHIKNAYYWPSKDRAAAMVLMGMNISEEFPVMYDVLMSNESMYIDESVIENELSQTAKKVLSELDVSNMLMVPIVDNAGMLKAAIATVNIPPESNRVDMLQCVTRDFFMAISNLESYTIIKNMGAVDYLTGIKNRNSYESEIKNLAVLDKQSLWCAYIDANGLHEVNNKYGHEAGDMMLKTVAGVIKDVFGEEWVYRLGGDEFVAFAANSNCDDFLKYKYRVMNELSEKGYHVSVGFEGTEKNENNVFDINKIVKAAETIMYKEKQKFYQEHEMSSERERFPVMY